MKRFLKYIIPLVAITLLIIGGVLFVKQREQTTSPETIRMVSLGDSLTEGIGDTTDQQGFTQRAQKELSDYYGVPVKLDNFGKAGDRSDQIEQRLKSDSKQQKALKKADVITLTVGGNDLHQQLIKEFVSNSTRQLTEKIKGTTDAYSNKLADLTKTIRRYNSDAKLYIFSNYNPIYVNFADRLDINQDIKMYNRRNRAIADQTNNAYYVSVFKELTFGQYQSVSAQKQLQQSATDLNHKSTLLTYKDVQTPISNRYISDADHFHPNPKGYQIMADKLIQKIKKTHTWNPA